MSYDDLTKLLVKHSLAVRNRPPAKLTWTPLSKKEVNALAQVKVSSAQELEELLVLYDPEETGLIGLPDFYLLLKAVFINNKDLLLYLDVPTNNIFEVEGSYKVLMAKLDQLLFDEIGLCKRMYQKSKNVSIEFSMFWLIISALLQTGILKLSFDKRTIVDLSHSGASSEEIRQRGVVRGQSQEAHQENPKQCGERGRRGS